MRREFSIPGITPTQNYLDGRHWTVKHRLAQEWHLAVLACAGRCPFKPTFATVEIIRVAKRLIDDLNVPAGCKALLDGFVQCGWLVDDSRKWCRVSIDQRQATKGEEEHMEIRITYS